MSNATSVQEARAVFFNKI